MNPVHTLSEEEAQALEHLHRKTNDADVRSRCDMILWSNEGLPPPEVAERVRFSRETVVRYIKRYEAEGLDGDCHHTAANGELSQGPPLAPATAGTHGQA
jgi:hypothetical protein